MKFRKVMTSIGTLKKQDFYDFDFTEEQLSEAKKRKYKNPLLIQDKYGSITRMYTYEGELCIDFFISYYGFREGLGEHKAKEFDNVVLCSCGKRFPQGKKKLGMKNFQKHFDAVEKLKDDAVYTTDEGVKDEN